MKTIIVKKEQIISKTFNMDTKIENITFFDTNPFAPNTEIGIWLDINGSIHPQGKFIVRKVTRHSSAYDDCNYIIDVIRVTETATSYVRKNVGKNMFEHELPTFERYNINETNDLIDSLDYGLGFDTLHEIALENLVKANDLYNNLQVFFNDKKKATTLKLGNKVVVVRCGKGDKYSKRIGFLEAYFQMMSGMSKTKAKNYLDKICEEE